MSPWGVMVTIRGGGELLLVILMNVSSPRAFRFRRYVWRQQQAISQRFSILRPPLFPRTGLLRAGGGYTNPPRPLGEVFRSLSVDFLDHYGGWKEK